MYALSLLFLFLSSFCGFCYTATRYRGYPLSTVSSTIVLNKSFARLRELVVLGSSRLIVVDGNILNASSNTLSTTDM